MPHAPPATAEATAKATVATEYSRLPAAVRARMLSAPATNLRVRIRKQQVQLLDAAAVAGVPRATYLAKLGVKTWRDSGSLHLLHDLPDEVSPLAARIESLLSHPTRQQRLTLAAYRQQRMLPMLYLLPFEDMTDTSEARFLAGSGGVSHIRSCLRGAAAPLVAPLRLDAIAMARDIREECGLDTCIVDLAVRPDGDLHLIEVNPALTPAAINTLKAVAVDQAHDDGSWTVDV